MKGSESNKFPSSGDRPLLFIPNLGQLENDSVRFYGQRGDFYCGFTQEEVQLTWITNSSQELKTFAIEFIDANSHVQIEAAIKTSKRINLFYGTDPNEWITDLPTYHMVLYREIWANIDLIFYEIAGRFKYDFNFHPGARIEDIRLKYEGVENVALDVAGELLI